MKFRCVAQWLMLIYLLTLVDGWSRMNETEAEAIRRYGESLPDPDPDRLVNAPISKCLIFKKDNYRVTTFFDASGKICWLTYQREPLKRLELVEIQTFLKANQEENNIWIPDGTGGFIRRDGQAYARIETFPYQGYDVPVSVSVFSLALFLKNGALRPDLNSKLPNQVNGSALKEF